MKLTFVFVVLGVLYFLSWIIQLVAGGQESAAQRRARLQARSEAMRRQFQGGQAQRPRPGQRPQPQPTREVQALRSLERTLGLPAGSIAPAEPTPPPAPTPAPRPAPRVVAPVEDHGGDLSDHHLKISRRSLPSMRRQARRPMGAGLSNHHLDSSFREERAWELAEQPDTVDLFERVAHLTPIQQAMIFSEIFQPPVSKRPRRGR